MRLYRFLKAQYGLMSLRDRRLRIGRIEELNDDFEFIGLALGEKEDRIALRGMRRHLDAKSGVLCMSKDWNSPLMWAHYADSHKGMVLGFDVPAKAFYKVDYVRDRPKLADLGLTTLDDITPDQIKTLIRTKAGGWSYEQEYRAYLMLNGGEEIDGRTHHFMPFSDRLRLRQVIVGSRFGESRQVVQKAVRDKGVDIFMARGAFETFRVVRQKDESRWK